MIIIIIIIIIDPSFEIIRQVSIKSLPLICITEIWQWLFIIQTVIFIAKNMGTALLVHNYEVQL